MLTCRPLLGAHAPDSPLIHDLACVFLAARKAHLQFLIDLHSFDEDRHFFSAIVLPQNQVWLAEHDGRLAGFIAFADKWVNHLYIDPPCQGLGFGRQLLDIAKRHHDTLQLWVFQTNPPAIAFYQREGFRVIQTTSGQENEARKPDALMRWSRPS